MLLLAELHLLVFRRIALGDEDLPCEVEREAGERCAKADCHVLPEKSRHDTTDRGDEKQSFHRSFLPSVSVCLRLGRFDDALDGLLALVEQARLLVRAVEGVEEPGLGFLRADRFDPREGCVKCQVEGASLGVPAGELGVERLVASFPVGPVANQLLLGEPVQARLDGQCDVVQGGLVLARACAHGSLALLRAVGRRDFPVILLPSE